MVEKSRIVAELGEAGLLLLDRITEALAANDRVKYYFALLQTARANADRPAAPPPDLKGERVASSIPDGFLDDVVAGTTKEADGYRIPHAGEVLARIPACIAAMIDCLPDEDRSAFAARAARLAPPPISGDKVAGALIDRMTSGDRAAGDSLHIVVMDAHKAINALQAATAPEILDGAAVHALSERGRRLVSAFMSGLNRTAPLKFDHPGLGTTATEHGGRLLIQNDIGTTDAHVLVLRVDGLTATLTYTDIHRARMKFFISLFSAFEVTWQEVNTRASSAMEEGAYLLVTATFRARDEADLAAYLAHLGSRIVFLIDWNHTRKRLRAFVSKEAAVRVLRWAAEHDVGQRGLLEVGGEKMLAEAVEFAAGRTLHYGDRLDELIGAESAEAFLRRAFDISARGLMAQRSRRVIVDEIKAELRRRFEAARLTVFAVAARHAASGFDLAVALREVLEGAGAADLERLAARAAVWESRADTLLNAARADIRRLERPGRLLVFFERADDAVDELEEAASIAVHFSALPAEQRPLGSLVPLADVALACAQELVKCVECAATITSADVRDDLDDFLKALDRLISLEHTADALTRQLRGLFLANLTDARALFVFDRFSGALETATDAYAHAAQALRDHLMEEVLA